MRINRAMSRLTSAAAMLLLAAAVGCHDAGAPHTSARDRAILFMGRTELPGQLPSSPAIWAIDLGDTIARRLASGLGTALSPAWSRDGTRIAFASGFQGGAELWLMNADGGSVRPAGTSFPTCDFTYQRLTWHPDGDRLAADCLGNTRIFDLRTGTTQSLSNVLVAHLKDPAWSPDGARLAFGVLDSPDVFAAAPDGSSRTLLLAQASEVAWSPDGRRLAFIGRDATGSGIFVAGADGAGRMRLTRGNDEGPAWSPDGKWVAFHRTSPLCADIGSPPVRSCILHWTLWVVRADGTGLRRLTPDSLQASRPTW